MVNVVNLEQSVNEARLALAVKQVQQARKAFKERLGSKEFLEF